MNDVHLRIFDPVHRSPLSEPVLSPDGSNVLFTVRKLDKSLNKYVSNIWRTSLESNETRPFTHGDNGDSHPKWSPTGKNIIFMSKRKIIGCEASKNRLWLIPWVGGEARPITTTIPEEVTSVYWSHNGKKLLFLGRVKTNKQDDTDLKIIDKLNYRWDGIGFYPHSRVHLFTLDLESNEVLQLTKGDYDVSSAEWSPTSDRLAFVANMSNQGDCTPMKDVWVISAKGGPPEKLVEDIATRGSTKLAWSPDGKYLAYTCMNPVDPQRLRHQYCNIWVKPLDGGEEINLTGEFDRPVSRNEDASLKWNPDSNEIFFISHNSGTSHIHKVDLNNKVVTRITKGEINVLSYDLSSTFSKIVYCATSSTKLPEVWVQENGIDKQVTSLTSYMIEGLPVTEPETFWFKASDSAMVQGWILKPHDFREGTSYPTILQIHGGPWSNYGYMFNSLFQHLASNGFVVVYINHRASTGYGAEFSNITGRWGDRDYKDLMEAMDFVLETYSYVDRERLGVGGCSGGGYLTNWIVTHTNRFKVAVTVASISNWLSFYGCSDLDPCHILNFWDLAEGKEPWEDPDAYLKPSPISYVKNVETPLLILHGEEDRRCPMEQAEQLYAALKKQGKKVKFIRFPGESHANIHTMSKPSHTTEALKHALTWYIEYI
jgi:dipeptidyl aminopeptidase/acylaminoacyl peptidase